MEGEGVGEGVVVAGAVSDGLGCGVDSGVGEGETTTEQIELAQTIYEQTLLQQKQGTANLTDVLLADNALREAQQTYINAVIEYLKADLELKKLTGNISTTK